MASVFITDSTAHTEPKQVAMCAPWARQASGVVELRRDRVYIITAATFAPGQQGAFWISVSGHGAQMEAVALDAPTRHEAGTMALNEDPYGCCVSCHNEMDGSFFQTGRGPMCTRCEQGNPPPSKKHQSSNAMLREKAPHFCPRPDEAQQTNEKACRAAASKIRGFVCWSLARARFTFRLHR